jgi:hypothetical protein
LAAAAIVLLDHLKARGGHHEPTFTAEASSGAEVHEVGHANPSPSRVQNLVSSIFLRRRLHAKRVASLGNAVEMRGSVRVDTPSGVRRISHPPLAPVPP